MVRSDCCGRLMKIQKGLLTAVLLSVCVLVTGCATVGSNTRTGTAGSTSPIDPHEKTNRTFYEFTDMVDRNVLAPVSDRYVRHVPVPMQRSIGHFYDNLAYPGVVLNDFLQGKVRQGFQDTLRFLVNSTVGVAGLFDVATPLGLAQHDEDFGQTLGVWGMKSGSYLFVPLLGPTTHRDAPGIAVGMVTNVLFYVGTVAGIVGSSVLAPIGVLGIIDKRARLSGPMHMRDQAALDPYLFVREGYLQQRKHLIYDGDPPPEVYDDLQEDSLPEESASSNSSTTPEVKSVPALKSGQ